MVCKGTARKISSVLVIFSILGWITFIAGFAIRINEYKNNDGTYMNPLHEDFFPYWCFAVGAPFLYVTYFFHLCFNIKFTHYLSILFTAEYFICGGGILYINGLFISYSYQDDDNVYFEENEDSDGLIKDYYWVAVEFVGVLVSVLFFWFSMMLWPCFKKEKSRGYYDY